MWSGPWRNVLAKLLASEMSKRTLDEAMSDWKKHAAAVTPEQLSSKAGCQAHIDQYTSKQVGAGLQGSVLGAVQDVHVHIASLMDRALPVLASAEALAELSKETRKIIATEMVAELGEQAKDAAICGKFNVQADLESLLLCRGRLGGALDSSTRDYIRAALEKAGYKSIEIVKVSDINDVWHRIRFDWQPDEERQVSVPFEVLDEMWRV